MQPLETYYDTGKPYEANAPSDARANAFSLSQFTVVGDKDADPAGALGASAFRLKLDNNSNFDFSVVRPDALLLSIDLIFDLLSSGLE